MLILLLIAASLTLTLTACGENEAPGDEPTVDEPTNDPTEEDPTEEEPTEDTPTEEEPEHQHTPGTPVEENLTEATCAEDGAYDEVVYCTECGAEISRTEKILSATTVEHQMYGNECTVCDYICESEGLEMLLNEEGTGYTVVGYGLCSDINIVIPELYEQLPVTGIASSAFEGIDCIVSIAIPACVTEIGDFAFRGCILLADIKVDEGNESYKSIDGNLYTKNGEILIQYATGKQDESFVIPDGVTKISDYACSGAGFLSVNVANSVTSIGSFAFEYCNDLSSLTLGKGVTTVHEWAFLGLHHLVEIINYSSLDLVCGSENYGFVANYAKLIHKGESKIVNNDGYLFISADGVNYLFSYIGEKTELVLPEGYNGEKYKINANTFRDRADITKVIIPNAVTEIGEYAFTYCTGLTTVTVPEGVTAIGIGAFSHCYGLKEITLPNRLTKLSEGLFYECTALTSVIIPDSVTEIESNVFGGGVGITNITVPSSVAVISPGAFSNPENIFVAEANAAYKSVDGNLYTKDGKTLVQYAGGKSDASVIIPEGVEIIGDSAFEYCDKITEVTLPSSVTRIDDYAFYGCTALTKATLSNSITYIGCYAFSYSEGLIELRFLGSDAEWSAVAKDESAFSGFNGYLKTDDYAGW